MKRKKILLLIIIFFLYFSCSLDVLSPFEVTACSIEQNGIIGVGVNQITVELSLECDVSTVNSAVTVEQDTGSNVQISVSCTGTTITIRPVNPWQAHQRFWLKIGTNLMSKGGKNLEQTFYRVFTSTASILPVSANLVSPELFDDICPSTIGEIDSSGRKNNIEVVFSGFVDKKSVEMNFSVEPKISGVFLWNSSGINDSFIYDSNDTIPMNSSVTITIGSDAKDIDGNNLKPFSKTFDYKPGVAFPRIATISCSGSIVFDSSLPISNTTLPYSIEDGKYIITREMIQKNTAISIVFSKSMNAATFSSNFTIQPSAKWREVWLTEANVQIYFEEDLNLEEHYTINIQRDLKDKDGLPLTAGYTLQLYTNGTESNYLECVNHVNSSAGKPFIINTISYEYWDENNNKINDPSGEGEAIVEYDSAYNGYIVKVSPLTTSIPTANLVLKFKLQFTNPGFVNGMLLILDELSVQTGVTTSVIYTPGDYSGSIYDYIWDEDDKSFCVVTFYDVIPDAIYSLTLKGGKNGI